MVKRKKIYLGFLRDRLRWLAFPHDLASVPLADVECYTRRVFIHFLARDDIVVMVVAAVPSSIGVFLGLVPASFGSCVVDRATNRSFEQIYGRLAHEREVGVVAAVAGQFTGRTVSSAVPVRMASAFSRVSSGWAWMRAAMCSVSSAGFADEMEVATIDLISAMFFIMVLDEKV